MTTSSYFRRVEWLSRELTQQEVGAARVVSARLRVADLRHVAQQVPELGERERLSIFSEEKSKIRMERLRRL